MLQTVANRKREKVIHGRLTIKYAQNVIIRYFFSGAKTTGGCVFPAIRRKFSVNVHNAKGWK
jgi:hypothetical protein